MNRIFPIILILLSSLSMGCVQQEKEEIKALKAMELPDGWKLFGPASPPTENDTIAVFQYRKEALFCQEAVMVGPTEKEAFIEIKLVKKWEKEDYERNEEPGERFNECIERFRIDNPVANYEECIEESGYRQEPQFNTENFSIYVRTACTRIEEVNNLRDKIIGKLKDMQ